MPSEQFKKIVQENRLKKDFLVKFGSLSFDDLILLKLNMLFPEITDKYFHTNLWKNFPKLIRKLMYNFASENFRTNIAKANFLGMSRFHFKKYGTRLPNKH